MLTLPTPVTRQSGYAFAAQLGRADRDALLAALRAHAHDNLAADIVATLRSELPPLFLDGDVAGVVLEPFDWTDGWYFSADPVTFFDAGGNPVEPKPGDGFERVFELVADDLTALYGRLPGEQTRLAINLLTGEHHFAEDSGADAVGTLLAGLAAARGAGGA